MENMRVFTNELKVLEKKYRDWFYRKANVCGVVRGYKVINGKKTDIPSLVIFVTKKVDPIMLRESDRIPREIEGVLTDVVEVGIMRANSYRTERQRPCKGGISVAHMDVTAGTLGCWFKRGSRWFALSNNHVFANSNDAHIGDPILQPGPYDGGMLSDVIAHLDRFVPISFISAEGCSISRGVAKGLNFLANGVGSNSYLRSHKKDVVNLVDCALAEATDESVVDREIYEVGIIPGWREADIGDYIWKSGRTSEITDGTIDYIGSVQVSYGDAGVAMFEEQFVSNTMLCAGGDSGSAVLDRDLNIIGLLFAGSDTSTIINMIRNVWVGLPFTPEF